MLKLLVRFLIWVALCTGVYFLAKHLGWSPWLLVVFAFVSLAAFLVAAARSNRTK